VTNAGDATVSVLLNQGQGNLQFSSGYEVGADNPEGITSADLNGYGRPDLATASRGSSFGASNTSVLLNTTGEDYNLEIYICRTQPPLSWNA
jgi:hypothetical protein